jgi:magnesium transporter
MADEQETRVPDARLFRELLEESPAKAGAMVEGRHPADVADWLQDVDEEDAWHVFSGLGTEARAGILEYAEDELRGRLVSHLSAVDLTELVDELPPDEAVDLLAVADQRVSADVLESIPGELAMELRGLISHPPESAGGIMTSDFVSVSLGTRLGDAIKLIKEEGEDAEDNLGLFVVDEAGQPVG